MRHDVLDLALRLLVARAPSMDFEFLRGCNDSFTQDLGEEAYFIAWNLLEGIADGANLGADALTLERLADSDIRPSGSPMKEGGAQ